MKEAINKVQDKVTKFCKSDLIQYVIPTLGFFLLKPKMLSDDIMQSRCIMRFVNFIVKHKTIAHESHYD